LSIFFSKFPHPSPLLSRRCGIDAEGSSNHFFLQYFFDWRDEEVFEHVHLVEISEGFVPVFDSDMFYLFGDFFEVFGYFFQLFRFVHLAFVRKGSDDVEDSVVFSQDVFFEHSQHIVLQIVDILV